MSWIMLALSVGVVARLSGGSTQDVFEIPGVESQRAIDLLTERFPAASGTSAQVVFAVDAGTVSSIGNASTIAAALADLATQPDVTRVSALRASADGTIAYVEVQYDRPATQIKDAAFARLETTASTALAAGVRIELGGELPSEATHQPPSSQELFGLVAAVIVLLLAFGSVIAMSVPIATALVGLATSIGLITAIASLIKVNTAAPILAAMIGLGVGIDYALFIVTRHREYLAQGMTVEDSAGRAIATSGSAVLFAGMTVVIAICGLAIAGMPGTPNLRGDQHSRRIGLAPIRTPRVEASVALSPRRRIRARRVGTAAVLAPARHGRQRELARVTHHTPSV